MLSGIGEIYDPATGDGLVGKNYCYQVMSGADVFFDDKFTNEFVGAGALGMCVDEYNGDNFDHSGLGFIGGGYISCWTTHNRPIERRRTPEGTPEWGSAWKKAVAENFLKSTNVGAHGASMAHAANHLDLDPTYTDIYGRPLMRMTFDFTPNDRAMTAFLTERVREIAGRMGGREIKLSPREAPYDSMPYQTTHNTGGTIMGADPASSAATGHESAGGHFNPGSSEHGYDVANGPHAGDMPNQYVPADGTLRAEVFNHAVTLADGETGIRGRALMVHAGADDYSSQPSGDAGDRLACAVIE